jgi:hypothetical protein
VTAGLKHFPGIGHRGQVAHKHSFRGTIWGKTGKNRSYLKNRRQRRQQQRAAIIGVLSGLGARTVPLAPLSFMHHLSVSPMPNTGKTLQSPQSDLTVLLFYQTSF